MADTATSNILVIWGDDIGITNLSCYSELHYRPGAGKMEAAITAHR